MTKYERKVWYGWNGGECPVHPKTKVIGLEDNGARWTAEAEDCDWQSFRGAFFVIKEHREPREWWINPARHEVRMTNAKGYVRVREVLE